MTKNAQFYNLFSARFLQSFAELFISEMELSYKINQSALRFKLVSPGWPTDRVQQFGYSGHSCAI